MAKLVSIMPCLDMQNGRVVKGVHFVDIKDAGDPAECAKAYCAAGADELAMLDITATVENRPTLLDVVRRTAAVVTVPFTVGGGIKDVASAEAVLKAGADKISINTAAILNPDLVNEGAERCGSQCIVVAIDAKRVDPEAPPEELRWVLHTHGGLTPTDRDALAWLREAEERGAGEFVLNSIDADGTKMGYDLELTRRVAESCSIPVVASGGAGSVDHMYDVLTVGKADAALAASIFHFRETGIPQVKAELAARGVPMRL